MGVVANFETVPADRWPSILDRLARDGIDLVGSGEEDGLMWCSCRLGHASLGITLDPSGEKENLCIYCGEFQYWVRLLSTRRLFREVHRVIREATR